MNRRVMALLLPVSCVIIVIMMIIATAFSLFAMLIMLVKPSIVTDVQNYAQKMFVRQMFGRMTKKAAARV